MRVLIRWLVGTAFAAGAGCLAQAKDSYRDMCDASAAVALGQGYFVVADDEGDVLRVYRRGSAKPRAKVDLSDYLRNRTPNGKSHEADIEGAAAIGERIYWISSHARKGKDGEADPHRRRFFATDIVRDSAQPSVKPAAGAAHESLLDELLADARFAVLAEAAKLKPEEPGGLNIEGLAATPEGGLLIGFRNPLPQGRALVVPLLNPREVIDGGANPVFGELIRLDLGGRGIRSMERVGDATLIVAGPHGDAASSPLKPSFALFRWQGGAGQTPTFVRRLDAGSFRAEALFFDPKAKVLVLLSDDGDAPVGTRKCKDKQVPAAQKTFRGRSLKLSSTARTVWRALKHSAS
jgi:hypothetical protein